MSEVRATIQQIRYSLNNLGAQNSHHDFESICRHISRKRLGLNVLPATGPVSAGGDQGRDFETYEILPEIALKSGEKLVSGSAAFACTIQKDNVFNKIKDDTKKIVDKGTKVDIVYVFSLENLVVAKRHELQKWAQDTYSVKLEIFDGEFIAENLADRDLFWIAIEYLQIPSSLYPKSGDIDYLKTKEEWESSTIDFPNYAIFDEIRHLGKRCLFDKDTKQDISFWIAKLEELLVFDSSQEFKRKVLYEIVALRIRGTGSLVGWEKYIRQYFELSCAFNNQVEAQEACVVVSYAYGSMVRGVSDIIDEEIIKWRKLIDDYANEELKKEYPKTIQALIYELKGYLLLTNPYDRKIDEGLDWWIKLAAIIKETPLFPLERFSDILVVIIDYVGDNPKYEIISNTIDSLLGERVGGFVVAEKCRDRSIAYRAKGELLKSLKELHKAMMGWYTHETLYGSLLSMLLIAQTYSDLGLTYAAKHYALAVTFIASRATQEREKVFIPRGLSALAEYEYANGEWAHFIEHADLSLRTLSIFTKGLADESAAEIHEKMSFYASLVSAFTGMLDKGSLPSYVEKKVKLLNSDIIGDLIPLAQDSWSKIKTDEFLHKIKTEFKNYPFNDVGQERVVKFNAFGISWKFSWKNGLLETAKSEQLLSFIQIFLAESIKEELYLLKGNVEIEIKLGVNFDIQNLPSKDSFCWLVVLPEKSPKDKEETEQYNREILGIAIKIFSEISLLPSDSMVSLFKNLFKDGFSSKTFVGNSYEVLFTDLVSKGLYEDILQLPKISHLKDLEFGGKVHKLLEWNDSVVGGFSEEQSIELIKKRYEKAIVPIYLTVQELRTKTFFLDIVRRLKMEGWKDWHVLMAASSIAVNYRIQKIGYKNLEEMKKMFEEHIFLKETSDSIKVPLVEFGEAEMRNHLYMTMPSTLKILGFEYKSATLASTAFQEFLDKRCRYFVDDVPHEDFFGLDS